MTKVRAAPRRKAVSGSPSSQAGKSGGQKRYCHRTLQHNGKRGAKRDQPDRRLRARQNPTERRAERTFDAGADHTHGKEQQEHRTEELEKE